MLSRRAGARSGGPSVAFGANPDAAVEVEGAARSRAWQRVRFVASWVLAIGLIGVGLPRTVDISWHGVVPVLASVNLSALLGLVVLWLLGLWIHSFVLTAANPHLNHRRALTLNVTGSAVANVVPLGGAAGVELNRRMMKAWGIGGRGFTGYTFLTNLWDIASKLLLPVIAVVVLPQTGNVVLPSVRFAALVAGIAFVAVALFGVLVLSSQRCTRLLARVVERLAHLALRLVRRDRELDLVAPLLEVRHECGQLVRNGWLRMSLGMVGYVALQWALLWVCLNVTGAGATWSEVLAGFAVERMLTVLPITPGGVGVADLGLVGVMLAFGCNPAGVAAGAVLFRLFIFVVEIPVGGGTLGLWALGRRRVARRAIVRVRPLAAEPQRIAHVTDVFLPRLGGIETHVDDLVRQQRASGLDADVLTPTEGDGEDPAWVRRIPLAQARTAITEYDAVHVHVSMLSVYGISVARAAMAAGVPTLMTVHSMWAGTSMIVRLAAMAALRRWPVAWSAVSGAAAEVFRRSLPGAPVAVLPNAVDVADWRPRTPEYVAESDSGPVTLVSVMRLMPRKRPVQLVRMFADVRAMVPHRDVRLVIVGDGPLRRRLERFIRKQGLEDSVELTGRIPRPQVHDELEAASVFVAPAPKESFGIAALEARCAGLPVVASRRSGIREFIRDRVDGVLVDGDTEMAIALAELVVDDELRHRIARHNHRVAPRFDWSDALDRTLELYKIAGERAAAAAAESSDLKPAALVEA